MLGLKALLLSKSNAGECQELHAGWVTLLRRTLDEEMTIELRKGLLSNAGDRDNWSSGL